MGCPPASKKISIGDTVFIWQSQGKNNSTSGVMAECRVVSPVENKPSDQASSLLWNKDEVIKTEPRVELLVVRVASSGEILKRDWLKVDPVLSELVIFKMAQSTNYLLTEQQAKRVNSLWATVGKDWSWRDSVAGLWAYIETKGKEVSKLSGSPVAQIALAISRVVGGVYNKVMNFRALDPNEVRAGLPGASQTDRKVWLTFLTQRLHKLIA